MNQDKLINEEYKLWKKNTPFLYDVIMTYALEWPSLTFQWLPDVTKSDNSDMNIHRVLAGTHAIEEQNFLMICKVKLPESNVTIDSSMENVKQQYGGFGKATGKFEVDIKICHDGEVNRARYMPQNHHVIATKSPNSDVYVFDYTKHPSKPDLRKGCIPDLKLVGHKKEGYGLSWNMKDEGKIISSSDDGVICHWDINASPKEKKTLSPLAKYEISKGGVEDLCWHNFHPHLLSSVTDDGRIMIWDVRSNELEPSQCVNGHNGDVYSLALSPYSEHIFATGASDQIIKIWDSRYMSKGSVHQIEAHKGDVIQLEWSPHVETMLASSSSDRRVKIWDLSRIGIDIRDEDLLDGPPELIFVHGGHTSKVTDISWNVNEPMMLGSVADDNIIQFWQMIYSVNDEIDEAIAEKRRVNIKNTSAAVIPPKLPKV